jgi:hypothetical protein
MMNRIVVNVLMSLAPVAAVLPAQAQVQTPAQQQSAIEERDRAIAQYVQAERQRRIERARQTCGENRGVDCASLEGLQEWLLLDRSRAEAVLDRIAPSLQPSLPSSSTGSSGR